MKAPTAPQSSSRRRRRMPPWWSCLPLAATIAGWPDTAMAGGFEIPDTGARAAGRGGAFTVGASDLTALHYNPGSLAKFRGTTFLYNHSLVFHNTRFERAPLADAWGDDAGTRFPEVSNSQRLFPLGLFAVLATDFGLENWTFAAGVYGPSSVGRHDYPAYGPQSFMLTDMDILMAYYTVGAAWKLRDVFGIGLTVQYVDLMRMRYGLVTSADAPGTPLDPLPNSESSQLVTQLDLKDRANATAQLGMWYRPHRRVEVGAATRFVPVNMTARGGVNVDKETLVSDDVTAEMPLTLPATARAGVRYIHPSANGDDDLFDLELNVFYENWSTIDAYELSFDGLLNGQQIRDVRIEKNWRDTVSVRLGGDVNVIPNHLTLRAGGFWESGAVPNNYSHLDFPSFNRGGIGAGVTGGARGVYLSVGFMQVFQEARQVDELYGRVYQQRPIAPCPDACNGLSGVPANAGTFRSGFQLLNLGIEFRFAELFGRNRRRAQAPPSEPSSPPSTAAPAAEEGSSPEETTPDTAPLMPEPDDEAEARDDELVPDAIDEDELDADALDG
jgi:long-subunit fatty acid transport protein